MEEESMWKYLPCGYRDFHHTQSYHLGNLRTKQPGRQGFVQKPVVTMYKWCSLTFLPRIMKWPVFFSSCLTHSLIFLFKNKKSCIELNHFWSEGRLCCEGYEKSKSITHKWHASPEKILGWLMPFWPITNFTDQYLSAYLIVFNF